MTENGLEGIYPEGVYEYLGQCFYDICSAIKLN